MDEKLLIATYQSFRQYTGVRWSVQRTADALGVTSAEVLKVLGFTDLDAEEQKEDA